jgi:hypothetical protein
MERNLQMDLTTQKLVHCSSAISCFGFHANFVQVRTTEDLTILIRELQELWFLGGLNTLDQPDRNKDKANLVALASEVIGSASLKSD